MIEIQLFLLFFFSQNVNSKPNNQHLISKTNYTVEQDDQNELFAQVSV